jgi:hypothetical protein
MAPSVEGSWVQFPWTVLGTVSRVTVTTWAMRHSLIIPFCAGLRQLLQIPKDRRLLHGKLAPGVVTDDRRRH